MEMTKRTLQNEEGMATLEAVSLMVVFVILLTYGVGMFGVIHSGILNSIAARTYAWETFNHRTNLNLFRDNRLGAADHYLRFGFRAHGVTSELNNEEIWVATTRPIVVGREVAEVGNNTNTHLERLGDLTHRERVGVNPIWLKIIYGICLNSQCGQVQRAVSL